MAGRNDTARTGEPSARDQASSVAGFTRGRLATTLGALVVAVFLASLESTIVNTALPTIAGELKAFESYAWVGTAYIVASAIATPVLGKLSDLYGRRLVFQSTMAVFFIGSLLCGIAQTMPQLIAARALQGLGGGAIQALAFAILGDILSPRDRGRYIGYFTIAFAAAALAGPLVGGFIIDHWSWHWIFLVNLPLVAAAGAATHITLRLPFTRRSASIDWLGAALLSAGLAALLISLERGRGGWARPSILMGLLAAGVLIATFAAQERRAAEPMIPLRLFADPVILGCCVIGLCIGSMTYGATTFLPLYFQDSLFASPTESGLRMMPVMTGVVIMSFTAGRVIARTGRYKPFPIFGCAACTVALLFIGRIDGSTSYIELVLPLALMGLGSGSVYTTTSIAAQNACQLRDLGVTTATVMFARSLGGSIGLAAYGTMLNTGIRADLPTRTGLGPDAAVALIRTPAEIKALPPDVRSAVIDTIASGVGRIHLTSAAVIAIALVWAIRLPERTLRSTAGITEALTEQQTGAGAPASPPVAGAGGSR
jgi:EmrB/QacA subfamily drug resistance transporter